MHTTDLGFGQSVSSHPTMQFSVFENFNRFQACMFALYHENNSSYFLSGDLTLDLTRMPRGAKSAKTCTLDLMKQDGSVPQISFFKIKHIKGFWPFVVNTDEEVPELAVSCFFSFVTSLCLSCCFTIRKLKQASTSTPTRSPPNKRFYEKNNGCALAS